MQWETPKGENKWCFCGIHCVHVRIISVARKFIIIILQLHVVTRRLFIFSGWMSCTAKKTNHPPIYCTNRSAVIITIVIILHSPFRLYAQYLLYVSCIFRCICELASFVISIQLLFISFLSNIVVNCFYYLCSKYDDIVNKLLKYEK